MGIDTINIKGGQYAMVKDRVSHFRSTYKDFAIQTDILTLDLEKGHCVVKATIMSPQYHAVATGLAHEWRDDRSSMVNRTSFVENAETSAIGRALACFGIGIEDAYASAFEVDLAAQKGAGNSTAVTPKDGSTPSASTIPKDVRKFGGRDLSELTMEELMELSAIATTGEWQEKIAGAMNEIASSRMNLVPADEVEMAPNVPKAEIKDW